MVFAEAQADCLELGIVKLVDRRRSRVEENIISFGQPGSAID